MNPDGLMLCAAIDIGSNTTRVLVAEPLDGQLKKVMEQRAYTRISKAVDAEGAILPAKIEEVGADRVVKVDYKGGEQTITIPTDATVVSFVKAPADQLVVGRKVFVVMKKDAPEAGGVVVGAEGVKPPM